MPAKSRTPRPPFPSRSHQVAQELRRRIEQGGMAEGEVLMTEGDVAREFGVSRTMAREAVSQLRALGLVEGRQRKGLIVRRPDPVRLLESSLPFLARSPQDMQDLASLRYVLEAGAIELAVVNATEAQIARLMELAHDYEKAIRKRVSLREQAKIDMAFHSLLLEMTGSNLIAGMQRVLVDFFLVRMQSKDDAPQRHAGWDDGVADHIELAGAVRDRDLERARTILCNHVRHYLPALHETQSTPAADRPRNRKKRAG